MQRIRSVILNNVSYDKNNVNNVYIFIIIKIIIKTNYI